MISTKLGRIFTYDRYLKNLFLIHPGIYLQSGGQKASFLEPTLYSDWTYLCNGKQSKRSLWI